MPQVSLFQNFPVQVPINPVQPKTPAMPVSAKKTAEKDFLTENQKVIFAGAALAGVVTVSILIARGQFSQAKKLAESIVFQKANTIEEAAAYAKQHLGIRRYKLKSVDAANLVNEGLTNLSNIYKGKAPMPKAVRALPDSHTAIASMATNGVMGVNEGQLSNIDEFINFTFEHAISTGKMNRQGEHFKLYCLNEKQDKILKKYLNSPKELDLKEKIQAVKIFLELSANKPLSSFFSDALHDTSVVQYLKNNNKIFEMQDFIKLNPSEQNKLFGYVYRNTGYRVKINTGGPFQDIYHEMGHYLHQLNIGIEKYWNMLIGVTGNKEADLKAMLGGLEKFAKNEPEWYLTGNVTAYAQFSPAEFVAETFACMREGIKFNDEIMALYKKYGGPLIP